MKPQSTEKTRLYHDHLNHHHIVTTAGVALNSRYHAPMKDSSENDLMELFKACTAIRNSTRQLRINLQKGDYSHCARNRDTRIH